MSLVQHAERGHVTKGIGLGDSQCRCFWHHEELSRKQPKWTLFLDKGSCPACSQQGILPFLLFFPLPITKLVVPISCGILSIALITSGLFLSLSMPPSGGIALPVCSLPWCEMINWVSYSLEISFCGWRNAPSLQDSFMEVHQVYLADTPRACNYINGALEQRGCRAAQDRMQWFSFGRNSYY